FLLCAAGFVRDDSAEQKLGKLEELLTPAARGDDEIELLTELLSLPSSAADLNLSLAASRPLIQGRCRRCLQERPSRPRERAAAERSAGRGRRDRVRSSA